MQFRKQISINQLIYLFKDKSMKFHTKIKKKSKDLTPDNLDAMPELSVDMDLPKHIIESENISYSQLNFFRNLFYFKRNFFDGH